MKRKKKKMKLISRMKEIVISKTIDQVNKMKKGRMKKIKKKNQKKLYQSLNQKNT